jgi:hypothetical protein
LNNFIEFSSGALFKIGAKLIKRMEWGAGAFPSLQADFSNAEK